MTTLSCILDRWFSILACCEQHFKLDRQYPMSATESLEIAQVLVCFEDEQSTSVEVGYLLPWVQCPEASKSSRREATKLHAQEPRG